MAAQPIQIRLLGPLTVGTSTGPACLPPSKKARALLAYLALSGRPLSRIGLAETFWGHADDGKGGLRWCLSKLRAALGDKSVLVSDRRCVAFDARRVWIDVVHLQAAARTGLARLDLDELEALAELFRGELLEGLEFAELHAAQAWLTAQRSELRALHGSFLREIAERLRHDPERMIPWCRRMIHLEPQDAGLRAELFATLRSSGRLAEADAEYRRALHDLEFRGASTHALQVARRAADRPPTGGPSPSANRRKPSAPICGRQVELDELDAALERTLAGGGEAILIAGEPGVGKSHLVRAFAAEAAARGVEVLHGASISADGAPAYTPFAEAFASLSPHALAVADCGIDQLLAELVPGGARGEPLGPPGDRYAVFRAVTGALRGIAAPHGALLIVEDLHWADVQSLALLAHLVRHREGTRLLLLATVRDTDLVRDTTAFELIGRLVREGARRLALGRLSDLDAIALITLLLARSGSTQRIDLGAGARTIVERTGGHPFFIEEMVRHVVEAGASSSPAVWTELGVPEGIRDLVRRRLARLSEPCNKLMAAASINLGPIEWPVLAEMCGGDEDELLDALDEALHSQLLREGTRQRSGTYEFDHALIRQAVYEDLASSRRVRLHDRLVTAVEKVHQGQLDRHLVSLAYHAGEAARGGKDLRRFLDYALRAGRAASRQMSHGQAAGIYQRALDILGESAAGELAESRADLHQHAGDATMTLGHWLVARQHYDRGLEFASATAPATRARLLVKRMHAQYRTRDTTGCRRDLEEAIGLADDAGQPLLAAAARGFLRTLSLATESIDPAGAPVLARVSEPELATEPLLAQAQMHTPAQLYWAGRFAEAIEHGRSLLRVAQRSDDPYLAMNVMPIVALALGALGSYRESERTFTEAVTLGGEHKMDALVARTICMSAGNCADLADYAGCLARAQDAHDRAVRLDFKPTIVSARLDLLNVAAASRDVGGAEPLFEQLQRDVSAAAGWHGWIWDLRLTLARAKMDALRGDHERGSESARAAVEHAQRAGRAKLEIEARWLEARAQAALGEGGRAHQAAAAAVDRARAIGHRSYLLRSLELRRELEPSEGPCEDATAVADALSQQLDGRMKEAFRAAASWRATGAAGRSSRSPRPASDPDG